MLSLIHLPYDSGHHGARMGRGPLHFRERGATDRLRAAGHDVVASLIDAATPFPTEVSTTFALQHSLADAVRTSIDRERFPLVLAGNCSSSLGIMSGIRAAAPNDASPVGVIWLDAHADFNTPETTTTGFLDGMALAALAGRCWHGMTAAIPGFQPVSDAHAVLLGARDIDAAEERLLAESRVTRVEAARLQADGANAALGVALTRLAAHGVARVYLHIDLDVHEPAEAQANHYAVPGGLSPSTVCDVVRCVADHFTIAAAALTAYDPTYDPDDRMLEAGLQLMGVLGQLGTGNRERGTEAAR
ncbi:MAG TPA: arginase family protein [Gemmatimonadaceae bacterium]|nr:arginase family protein [Gemmatimonadaceae bacterium]